MTVDSGAHSTWMRVVARNVQPLAIVAAVRQMLAFALPLALGVLLDQRSAGLSIGLGAMASGLPASSGPYRTRVLSVVATTVTISFVWVVGSLGASPLWLAATVAFALIFCGTFSVVLGMPAAMIGGISTMFTTVALGFATPLTLSAALGSALYFVIGGLWSLLLVSLAWPFERDRPDRELIAAAYRSLAGVADAIFEPADDSAQTQSRSHFQVAYQNARAKILHARRGQMAASSAWSRRAAVVAALPQIEDRMLRVSVNANAHGWGRAEVDRVSVELQQALVAISETVVDGRQRSLDALEHLNSDLATLKGASALDDLMHTLTQVGMAAVDGNAETDSVGRTLGVIGSTSGWIREALVGNLNWSSIALRHAVRVSVLATIALVIVRALDIQHGFWVPMTIVIVMIPDYGGTVVRGLQRAAGTLTGAFAAILLMLWDPNVWVAVGLAAVFMFAAVALIQINYGVAVALITGIVLMSMSVVSSAGVGAAEMRLAFTALGAVLAILAAGYLWPLWGRQTLRGDIADLFDGVGDLVHGVCTAPASGQDWGFDPLRRSVELTLSNVNAVQQRMLTDPRSTRGDLDAPIGTVVAARSLINFCVAIELGRHSHPPIARNAGVEALANGLRQTLKTCAQQSRMGEDLPDPVDLHALLDGVVASEPELHDVLQGLVLQTEACIQAVRDWHRRDLKTLQK